MADATNTTDDKAAPAPKKKSWFKGMKSEFKKISWPSRETVFKESTAVILITIALGLIISVVDTVLDYGLNLILKL